MSNVAINISSEFTGKPAFSKAGKSVSGLEKQVSKLGKQILGVFAAQKIIAFGKASTLAFLEAEKANTRLTNVVDNLGLSFAQADIQKNLDSISAKAGIAGEVLVDAFQPLLTTTGSVIKSQELLTLALDVSAGSGVALETVAQDLALSFTGVTKGLKKYNLGLTQTELKAASFNKVQTLLNDQFSGSSSKYLATYAGQMAILTEAAGNAQETIGKGLVDALISVGGDTSVEDLASDMDNLATYTSNVIRGLGNVAGKLKDIGKDSPDWLNKLSGFAAFGVGGATIKKGLDALAKSGGTKQSTGFSFFGSPMEQTQKAKDAAAAAKAEKDAKKRADALAKASKQALKLEKDKLALKRVAGMQDMQQIQLIAALQGNLSKEERNRAELQLAILTGNTEEAKRLAIEVAKSIDSTGALAKLIRELPEASNPFKSWDKYLDTLEERIKKLNVNPPTPTPTPTNTPELPATNVPPSDYSGFLQNPDTPGSAGSGSQFGPNTPWAMASQNIILQVDGKEMAKVLLDQSMSAGQVAYLDRRTGGF